MIKEANDKDGENKRLYFNMEVASFLGELRTPQRQQIREGKKRDYKIKRGEINANDTIS